MHDKIFDFAKDPSCILAVTPDNGGSWGAPLRPNQPRSFKTTPKYWTDFEAVAQEQGSSDLRFDIVMSANSASETYAYGFYAMSSTFRIAVFQSESGIKYGSAIVYADGTSLNAEIIRPAGKSIRISFVLKSTACEIYADGVLLSSDNGSKYTGYVKSNNHWSKFDGSISEAKLTNLTTNTVVWEASHSELWDTNNPWPSPTPRNFAEEPEAWRDEKTTAPAIEEDDCEFFIRYRLDGYLEGSAISQIFYHNSQNGSINIAFAGNGTGGNYSVIRLTGAGAFVIPLDRVRQLGEHTIRIQRIGQTVTVEFDGEIVATSTGAEKVAVYSTTAPASDFDGVIFETYWKSLTTGRTVWRYPSEAERVRLITKTNVRTDRGVFEAADTSKTARVDTALDLRGRVSSYTLFVDFEAADLASTTETYIKQELAGQGPRYATTLKPLALGYSKQLNVSTFRYFLSVEAEVAAARTMLDYRLSNPLFGRNCAVAVVDVKSSATEIALYLNGTQLGSRSVPGIPSGATDAAFPCFALFDNRNGTWTQKYGSVHSCLLFDRALSAGEIAAIS